jgi:hypothetical protein
MAKFEEKIDLMMATWNTHTEAMKVEQDPETMRSVEEHQEIPSEDVAVMPVKGLRKQRRVLNPAAHSSQKKKDGTRRDFGSRRKSEVACRKVSRHATVAWRKRKTFRKSVIRGYCGSRKGVTVADRKTSRHAVVVWRKRNFTRNIRIQESRESSKDFAADGMRKGPKCKNGIRRRDIKEPPRLRMEGKTASSSGGWHKREQQRLKGMSKYNNIYWRTTGLEFVERANEMSSKLQKVRNWTVWRGRPTPKRKKK